MKKEIFEISEKELENISGGIITSEEAGKRIMSSCGKDLANKDVLEALHQDADGVARSAEKAANNSAALEGLLLLVGTPIVLGVGGLIGWAIGKKSGRASAENDIIRTVTLNNLAKR